MVVERACCLLIQFARAPRPGFVKTRMQPMLSPHQAASLHRQLVLWTNRTLVSCGLGPVQLWVSADAGSAVFRSCLRGGTSAIRLQQGADLGERMYHALSQGLQNYRKVILVGSDCPALDKEYLSAALAALDRRELVLGAAEDGGYVLIGARRVRPELFAGVSWGQATVFAQTRRRIERAGMSWQALPALQDIDRPEDLPAWERIKRAGRG